MKWTHVIAILVGLAAIVVSASDAHARYYQTGINVYPAVATPMPPAPMPPVVSALVPPMSPMAALPMPGRMPTPMAAIFAGPPIDMPGILDTPHVGVNVYPSVSTPMPSMPPDPMAPPVLFDPTGQHPDGPNLYQYVRSNPVNRRDPDGLLSVRVVGPATPAWNTPPGPACKAYVTPPCCNKVLEFVCNNAGSGCWSNCVRGCLLADWNARTCVYNSGLVSRHAACFNYCDFTCYGGIVVWTGSGPCPSMPPP